MSSQTEALSREMEAIAYLKSPKAIRDRCGYLFEQACHDQLRHFRCDLTQLDSTVDYVLQVMRENYPDLKVPFHSRWRHFDGGGIGRLARLHHHLNHANPIEQARAKVDLVIVSVLLDAGAGSAWQYREPETGLVFRRSEGLAIASFHLFCQGKFSSNSQYPLQVDAAGLQALTDADLKDGLQVSSTNPLVGLQGRLDLLHCLGQALQDAPHLFHPESLHAAQPRPGHLVDYLVATAGGYPLAASAVLRAVLDGLGNIWAGRVAIAGVNLGDVWPHAALPGQEPDAQLVPFHKLSQWLTYSLLEPLQDLGLTITGLDELTGLAEYRNGGLCVDLGLLQPKHEGVRGDRHLPSSEVIVEWRALTVILLDRIADAIRYTLGVDAIALPLVNVLEGGTWAAGRKIAATLRADGIPPIQIESDGTVF